MFRIECRLKKAWKTAKQSPVPGEVAESSPLGKINQGKVWVKRQDGCPRVQGLSGE